MRQAKNNQIINLNYKVMTRKRYLKRMRQHEATFDRLWAKIVKDTNDHLDYYTKNNKPAADPDTRPLSTFLDSLCLSGAWIKDRIEGRTATHHHHTYRGSLTKKIRKALGYTL
jgi:hypothetical protein